MRTPEWSEIEKCYPALLAEAFHALANKYIPETNPDNQPPRKKRKLKSAWWSRLLSEQNTVDDDDNNDGDQHFYQNKIPLMITTTTTFLRPLQEIFHEATDITRFGAMRVVCQAAALISLEIFLPSKYLRSSLGLWDNGWQNLIYSKVEGLS